MAMVLNFWSLDRPRTTFMSQDVLVEVLGAIDLMNDLAQAFGCIGWRIL